MSNEAITEYLNSIRDSYQKASRREKARILEGAILATRFSRKHLIRVLSSPARKRGPGRGRQPVYGPEIIPALKAIWFLMEQPYILQPPRPWGFGFGWSGLRLSSGLVYTRTRIGYAMPVNFSSTAGGTTAVWLSSLDLSLVSNVVTVPTDVVTGVQFLKIFTLYGGLGLDINAGGASTEGSYNGTFSANGARLTNVNVDMDSDQEKATPLQIRTLLGLQAGVDTFSVHAQVAFANPSTLGLHLGLVAAW